jgi:hypothetical protein
MAAALARAQAEFGPRSPAARREAAPVQLDVEPLQGNVVQLSPDRLEAFFADERHQAPAQGEEFRRHHHGLMPRPFQRNCDLGLDRPRSRGHAVNAIRRENCLVDVVGHEQQRSLQPLPHAATEER